MADERDFEKLLREKFEGYNENPSEEVWKGVHRNLQIHDFFSFSFSAFNIYYLAAIVVSIAGGIMLFSGNDTAVQEIQSIEYADTVKKNETVERKDIVPEDFPEPGEEQGVINTKTIAREISAQETKVPGELPVKKPQEDVGEDGYKEPALQTKKEQVQAVTPLIASFSMSQRESCGPALVEFQNLSRNAVNFTWDFGDGVISNQMNPVYLFEKPGTYFIELTANDVYGNSVSAVDTLIIKSKPRAQFEFLAESNGQINGLVYFYNYSRNADGYLWNFGDGNTSAQINPTHIYKDRDDYKVSLVVFNSEGCSDTMIVEKVFPESDYFIRFPNAFSPNPSSPGDGSYSVRDITNQVFFPVWSGIAEYNLQIFNRAGVLLFESKDVQVGWNGYYRNQLAKPDVYIWKASGKFINGRSFVLTGDVTVILRR